MIPYKDDNPTEGFPYLTVCIIAVNIAVYLVGLASASSREMVYAYGAIPASIMSFEHLQPVHPFVTVFTSMFIHGGILHLGGNMLYLWIFGDNIESRLGAGRFLLFYFSSGLVAAYAHALSDPASSVPMVGASGAVAGILGAYVLLYPRARVYTLMFFVFIVQVVRLPALIVIGFWAIIQVISGITDQAAGSGSGVAWFAHIGGFLFGLLTIKILLPKRRRIKW